MACATWHTLWPLLRLWAASGLWPLVGQAADRTHTCFLHKLTRDGSPPRADRDNFLSPKQAVELGLIDGLIS